MDLTWTYVRTASRQRTGIRHSTNRLVPRRLSAHLKLFPEERSNGTFSAARYNLLSAAFGMTVDAVSVLAGLAPFDRSQKREAVPSLNSL